MSRGEPFGYQHAAWLEFRRDMKRGDELWEYSHTYEGGGQSGYVIVRSCNALRFFAAIYGDAVPQASPEQ